MKGFYPWDRWSDGQVHRLERRTDFYDLAALRGAAHSQGLKRGGQYSIRQEVRGFDDVVLLQFKFKKPKSAPAPTVSPFDLEFVKMLLKLVHPDKHPGRWENDAKVAFQKLSDLRDKLEKEKREREARS